MSPSPVADELESEESPTQKDVQGDPIVNCRPVACCVRRVMSMIDIREAISPGE